jgi:DNA-binding transcriptional LysR family regulator
MDWDKLKTFHAVAETGSLTSAAERIGLSQSAASRQMAALEDHLRTRLFHRHARGLSLTESGIILYRTTQDLAARIQLAREALTDAHDRPRGELHLTVPVALGVTWLIPRLARFRELYPQIELHVETDDEPSVADASEMRAAIRIGPPQEEDVIARHLLVVRQGLYASHGYIAAKGRPNSREDLDAHVLIGYGAEAHSAFTQTDWHLDIPTLSGKARKPAMTIANMLGVVAAIRAGAGIGSLPSYLAAGQADIARLLPEEEGPELSAYMVYPEELRGSQRLTALWDFLSAAATGFG